MNNIYTAIFDVQKFAGYALWCVYIKPDGICEYMGGSVYDEDAILHAGRTDNIMQGFGMVSRTLAGAPISSVTQDWISWPKIRAEIKHPDDKKRFGEGVTLWQIWDGNKETLQTDGEVYYKRWNQEKRLREKSRQEALKNEPEFSEFIKETGIDFTSVGTSWKWEYESWKWKKYPERALEDDIRAQPEFAEFVKETGQDSTNGFSAWKLKKYPDRNSYKRRGTTGTVSLDEAFASLANDVFESINRMVLDRLKVQ